MNFHNIIVVVIFVIGIFFFSHGSFANVRPDVPVVDATQGNLIVPSSTKTGNSNEAKIPSVPSTNLGYNQLSQQVQNLANMNLPQQISELQQKLQQLQGQLRILQHNVELLNIQQRSFYEDLNQRINQMTALSDKGSEPIPQNLPKDNTTSTNTVSKKQSTSTAKKTNEAQTYQNAFQQLMKKQYSDAGKGLKQYLRKYPSGNYADNSHYWLGEIYLLQDQLQKAVQEFNTVINKYKASNKVPDAKLKLASIHLQQGNVALARREMQQVKLAYPDSTAAQLATIQLQRLDNNHTGENAAAS